MVLFEIRPLPVSALAYFTRPIAKVASLLLCLFGPPVSPDGTAVKLFVRYGTHESCIPGT